MVLLPSAKLAGSKCSCVLTLQGRRGTSCTIQTWTAFPHCSTLYFTGFTAQCYAERGTATASRLSVRLSVCDVEVRGHIAAYRLVN